MVRVPKLPLSITAVDSNTPSSISTTDIDVRTASLVTVQLFRVSTRNDADSPGAHSKPRNRPRYVDGRRSKRPEFIRQPLPKTARSGGTCRVTRERCQRICQDRTRLFAP